MRTLLPIALCLASASASAVPLTFPHQARVLDTSGAPIQGEHDLTLRLYDADGTERWADTFPGTPIQDGYVSVLLGSGTPLDAADLAGDDLSVGITIGSGAELSPRSPLASVPYAAMADTATNLQGGSVDASEVRVNGTTVIGADGQIQPDALGMAQGHTVPRVYRLQAGPGHKSCGSSLPSLTFPGTAGEAVTIWVSWTGRPDANGHTYLDLYLNGGHIGATGDWNSSNWRRELSVMSNAVLTSTGTQSIHTVLDCGNGTSSYGDTTSEWPQGGLSYTVLVGG